MNGRRDLYHFKDRLKARLLCHVNTTNPVECWLWSGWLNNRGYGQISVLNKKKLAHRVAYNLFVGPIADGLEIDHVCRTRRCVNPSHLRLLDHKANVLCGDSLGAKYAARTHCGNGHPFSGDNLALRIKKTGEQSRVCRSCRKANNERRYPNAARG